MRIKTRRELPWLYYPESDRVIINAHNFTSGAASLQDAVVGYMASLDTGAAADDQFGTATNGTFTGVTRVDDGGLAYNFVGASSQYIRVASGFPTWKSVSMWVKPPATRSFSVILDSYEAFSFNQGLVLFSNADGSYEFSGRDSGGYKSSGASGLYADGEWHHIVGNMTTTKLQIWVAGAKENEGAIVSQPVSRSNLSLGGYNFMDDAPNNYFYSGKMDDIVFFNRELTAVEIAYLASQRGAIYL